ncbi:MAG: nucleotide exchange factor GrpE [Nitrospinae bacterium]|nr:nucleotide exchange factor GrpE [Nitrospinota bacterium]
MKARDVKVDIVDENGAKGEAASDESVEAADAEEEAKEKPRVVDRRRVREDGEVSEESAGEAEETPRVPAYVEQLQAKVAAAEEKFREYVEKIDKDTADFRARQEREMERRSQEVKKQAVSGFLGIADDLARATAAVDGGASGGEAGKTLETLVQGVRMIQGRFFQELSNLGVEPLSAMGVAFNPEEHEAVRMVEVSEEAQDGLVVEELAPGYKLGDAVLRPARVSVGKYAGRKPDARP